MLTELEVRRAQVREKDYKLADAAALYLHVATTGRKTWRWKYRHGGKERRIVFGAWPDVTLKQARALRDDARQVLRTGEDPGPTRKATTHALSDGPLEIVDHSFERYAREWHEKERARWKPVHANDVITSMENNLFPVIGHLDVAVIDQPMLLAALRVVEKRAIETAHRLRQRASSVFDYADAVGRANGNPANRVKAALRSVPAPIRRPALTDIVELRKLMALCDRAGASPVTRLGSRFLAVTGQRPGMVNALPWGEIEGVDWSKPGETMPQALWRIPADRMKIELDVPDHEVLEHLVPISKAAVEILCAIRPLTFKADFVFPSSRSVAVPMSENTINALYRRMGYVNRHVPHGWRSSFSTVMNARDDTPDLTDRRLLLNRLVIDLMLAHIPPGMSADELTYNRNRYMNRMRAIAEDWAELLLEGAPLAVEVLEGPRRPLSRRN